MQNFGHERVAVAPYADAQKLLSETLQTANLRTPNGIANLRISLGWLKEGGTTNTPVPQPVAQANRGAPGSKMETTSLCVDIPAFGKSFIFAPVAKEPSLVNAKIFSNPDGKTFCSVVKVEADVPGRRHDCLLLRAREMDAYSSLRRPR